MSTPVTGGNLLKYSAIALPVAFAGFPLYVLAPDFYATQHGLSLTLLGVVLLVIRLFDAVQDIVIGWYTDRLQGRFLMPMLLAATVLCAAVFALFNVMPMAPVFWFVWCMLIAVTAYSVISIMLGARATLWTNNRQQQTRIASARESFALIGLVIGVSMPALLQQWVPAEQVFWWYGLTLCVLMLAGLLCFSLLPAVTPVRPKAEGFFWQELVTGMRALPSTSRKLLLVYGVSMLASSVPAVLVIFYVRDLLEAASLTGIFLLTYFLSGVAGMPLWNRLSVRIGKYRAWGASMLLAVAGFVGAFFLGPGDIGWYVLVCLISGVALGADLSLPPSILADDIHAEGEIRFSASWYALLMFLAKFGLALASCVALPLLDISGFRPGEANTDEALFALALAYALIPCALKLLAVLMLYRFFSGDTNSESNQASGNNRSSCHA